MLNFLKYFLIGLVALALGVFVGLNWRAPLRATPIGALQMTHNDDIRKVPDGVNHFTSPLLECAELPENVSDASLEQAKSAVEKLIATRKAQGNIVEASVYFRDLNNGPWFGINEDNKYFPASLLKLPLAMSYYDRVEEEPGLLSKELVYKPDPSVTAQLQPYGKQDELISGKKYSVQELLDLMLTESNNEAANTLAQYGGISMIDRVYHDLGLTLPSPGVDYNITTHKYASFFRILYNATYVDRVASEKILKTLTGATFSDGLVAGVPSAVNVSHKFGTRGVTSDGSVVQLHDCGIVYAPKKPYILCVMTQGSDFTKLAAFIKDTSAAVYSSVISK